ncbi:hypothetical protein [Leptospira andrefontaineae]|uniref:Uncharacterized protein n=1 Tax=Leptospira andrefontaineae TaxID=2484976 RepID=A0A4R9H6P0_9LEPT|nr:hypothetical protein [Leptospira andrefontaineae]TGK41238.1 hypothetical protein EHO65_07350 [Leptospira andrefontaineae]
MKNYLIFFFFAISCVRMTKSIGYVELSSQEQIPNLKTKKEFKYCGTYPTILGDAFEEFRKYTGKMEIENTEIMIDNRAFVPCVLIYYPETEGI